MIKYRQKVNFCLVFMVNLVVLTVNVAIAIPSKGEYPAQHEGGDAVGVADGVREAQRGPPASPEHHPLVHVQLTPQQLDVRYQVPRRVLLM